jgi:hypothetical protein
MTTVAEHPAKEVVDLRSQSRWLAAVILPIGPTAVAVLRFILPYTTADSPADAVQDVAAHQATQSAVVWLGWLACLTLVPGVIFAGRVVGRRAPRLAAAATALLVIGYLSLAWLTVGDAYLLYGVRHHLPPTVLIGMYNGVHPAAQIAEGLFVLGHVLGTILLGIAMLRSRVVPTWAAVATIIAQPIHFVAAVLIGSHALDLLGWGLNAIGFAALSLAVLQLSNDEWGPSPAPQAQHRRDGARRSQ